MRDSNIHFSSSFDSWGTNTFVFLRSSDSLGTNTFLFICSFNSWGSNVVLFLRFDPKRTNLRFISSSFFMFTIWDFLRHGAWPAPGRVWTTVACAAPGLIYTAEACAGTDLSTHCCGPIDLSTLQSPLLNMDVSIPHRTWAAPGRVYTTESWAAPRRVYISGFCFFYGRV